MGERSIYAIALLTSLCRASRYNGGNPPSGSAVPHGGNPQERTASPQRAGNSIASAVRFFVKMRSLSHSPSPANLCNANKPARKNYSQQTFMGIFSDRSDDKRTPNYGLKVAGCCGATV
ncbi:MAG: hypothetical protein V7K97_12535 [Nostoc sp.]|uniref:hypothetical protein n=1 Tax=Nostoc sp. TaxID=1180 RepID=UPI002FF87AE5